MAMENTARKMEQQDEFEEQMDADLDAMLDSYMDEDKVEEKYDNMDRAAYDKEQEKLKDAIQQQVEASMAAAPEPAKQAVQESANELYSAMDGVHDAETYFTAEPKTWKDFGTKHLKEMQDAMQEAKSLTRQSLTDARDTVKEGFVDKTAQVVGTMKEAAAFLHHEQDRIEEENLTMRKALDEVAENMRILQAIAQKSEDAALMQKLADAKKDIQDMALTFGNMYAVSAKKENPKFIPAHAKMCINKAKQALVATAFTVSTMATMAKSAARDMKDKSHKTLHSIFDRVKKAAQKAKAYMSEVKQTFSKGIMKTAEKVKTIPDYKAFVGAGIIKPGQTFEEVMLKEMARRYVQQQAKDGATKKEIHEGADKFAKLFAGAVQKETSHYVSRRLLEENDKSQQH